MDFVSGKKRLLSLAKIVKTVKKKHPEKKVFTCFRCFWFVTQIFVVFHRQIN